MARYWELEVKKANERIAELEKQIEELLEENGKIVEFRR